MSSDEGQVDVFFDSNAFGWFLRLFFFPSGVLTLIFICFLLKRGAQPKQLDQQQQQHMSSDIFKNTPEDETTNFSIFSNDGDDLILSPASKCNSEGGRVYLSKDKYDREIERICTSLKVERFLQRELENCGRIDSNSCGYCLGEGHLGGFVKLPCGHYHHRSCVNYALTKRIVKCVDCGDNIINLDKCIASVSSPPPQTY